MRCSFCHKPKDAVAKLISSPSDYPRSYICDECIAVCHSIMEDHWAEVNTEARKGDSLAQMFVSHPLAETFFSNLRDWVDRETRGEDASANLAEVRRLAMLIVPYRPSETMSYPKFKPRYPRSTTPDVER
jgi:hypothetical protein